MTDNHGLFVLSPRLESRKGPGDPEGVLGVPRFQWRWGGSADLSRGGRLWVTGGFERDSPRTRHAKADETRHAKGRSCR